MRAQGREGRRSHQTVGDSCVPSAIRDTVTARQASAFAPLGSPRAAYPQRLWGGSGRACR
eukprot:1401313-Pyramimonas_sp.AAC.1